jgi:hypothetical protein
MSTYSCLLAWRSSLSTLQGALIAATAPFAGAGVVGAVIARRLRLAAFAAGGELPVRTGHDGVRPSEQDPGAPNLEARQA